LLKITKVITHKIVPYVIKMKHYMS